MIFSVSLDPETPMKFVLQPWQLFILILASWINRQQQDVIHYLEPRTQC
jgi:hypothetical protein